MCSRRLWKGFSTPVYVGSFTATAMTCLPKPETLGAHLQSYYAETCQRICQLAMKHKIGNIDSLWGQVLWSS